MKQDIKLGIVCLARKTFDYEAAKTIYDNIKQDLKKIDHIQYTIVEELVIEVEDAKAAAQRLVSDNVDAVVIISGTFHLGHLVLEIDKVVNKPILLWGLKELPYNGGKIRLNSVCGVNLNASNLYKSGNRRYYAIIQDKIDENWIDAIRIQVALKCAHIGILGYRAHGFFNLGIDELNTFQQAGILLDHYELSEVFDAAVDEQKIAEHQSELLKIFDVSGITKEQLGKVALLGAKMEKFINTQGLSGLAVRCWPEFARDFGVAPCAAMSYLQSKGYIIGCEGDVEGVMSMLAHQAVGGQFPFLADLSQVDLENDFALLWHCGVAPCNLWDGKCVRSLDTYFAGGKGVTADFVMKDGEFTILRLDSSQGKYRVFMQKGKTIPMDKLLKGTYAKVQFEQPVERVLNKVIDAGVAHHVSMVYGDFTRPFEIFAKIQNWEIIR